MDLDIHKLGWVPPGRINVWCINPHLSVRTSMAKSGRISFPNIKVGVFGTLLNSSHMMFFYVFLSLLIALAYFEP